MDHEVNGGRSRSGQFTEASDCTFNLTILATVELSDEGWDVDIANSLIWLSHGRRWRHVSNCVKVKEFRETSVGSWSIGGNGRKGKGIISISSNKQKARCGQIIEKSLQFRK